VYNLPYFTENNEASILAFIKENPFALIVCLVDDFPVATQLPFEVEIKDDKIFLSGHLMKKTDHHLAFLNNPNVLIIFTGANCYISSSWYENPQQASTWNYMSVQMKGQIKFNDDADTLKSITNITNKYEGTESNGAFKNIPSDYIQTHIKAIVSFTIEVEEVKNTFKLSQNKSEIDKQNIVAKLKERNGKHDVEIAKEIEKRINS
jgi:transcriptional regulator